MIFRSIKGILALDIDGTVTAEAETIPSEVVQFFVRLYQRGWQFIFITGRSFQWGIRSLNVLPFPYALAVQNGALILDIPSEKILFRQYLSLDLLTEMDFVAEQNQTNFVIYSGYENQDLCYYQPDRLPPSIFDYLCKRKRHLKENWISVTNFNELPVKKLASLKFFAEEKKAHIISQAIEKRLGFHAPTIRDPFSPDYFVVQVTHPEANKGSALKTYSQLFNSQYPTIGAGNDLNDLLLIQEASIKVVMGNAPEKLLALADIIAPTAEQKGIIVGLMKAIEYLENKEINHDR
jgi:hydroxymethylpyrimidine pyrophosphatase-like HAD family hydrolase